MWGRECRNPVVATFYRFTEYEIYNLSVIQGKHPSKLKLTEIVPVYKGGDESCASNHRTISLLSTFNRIFEKLV